MLFLSRDICYASDSTNMQSGLMVPHQVDAIGLRSGAAEVLHMPTNFQAASETFLKGRQKKYAAKVKMTTILLLGLKCAITLQIISAASYVHTFINFGLLRYTCLSCCAPALC